MVDIISLRVEIQRKYHKRRYFQNENIVIEILLYTSYNINENIYLPLVCMIVGSRFKG